MYVTWSEQQCLTAQVNFVDQIEGGVLSRNLFWLLSIIRPWHFEKQNYQPCLCIPPSTWSHILDGEFELRLRTSVVELVRNLMAHAQKPDFDIRLNGRVHLNRRGSQFSRLLAAEVCGSALVMLDILRPEVVWEYWLPTPFASFPFTSPPVRHRVPPHSERSIQNLRVVFAADRRIYKFRCRRKDKWLSRALWTA